MKYFNQLNDVETQIIRLGEMSKLMKVICNGADTSTQDELQSAICYIEGSIDDISTQLMSNFQNLFDSVKAE